MRTVMLVGVVLGVSACGGGVARPTLVVSAAASLQKAFTRYGEQFSSARSRFSFAGSDVLAAQIEQGVRPDVFALGEHRATRDPLWEGSCR